jgi:hypothetical protein
MSNITITSSGSYASYTLSQPLTNGQNITFANNGGEVAGGLILTDNPQGSAFNTGVTNGSYYANIGGQILNFQPAYDGAGGNQVTIQVVKDLFAELFPSGTANPDYTGLLDDITTAAHNGSQFIIEPSGSINLIPGTHFTLDAAQQLVLKEVDQALFGTAAAADGAAVDFAFTLRQNPNSNTPFVDTVITTLNEPINPCFAAGTRILTANGEIPVEALNIGDTLITHDGEEHPILWIGRRTINLTTHPRPETVRPVIIEPGALAENTPARRFTLSPDHALYLEGVLVPAKELLNWNSIRQDTTATTITYYHLELARHGIIFAEATPAETYLDTGHRGAFDNADTTVVAHPALMQQRRTTESCAPLCLAGPQLAQIRQRIAARLVGVRLG